MLVACTSAEGWLGEVVDEEMPEVESLEQQLALALGARPHVWTRARGHVFRAGPSACAKDRRSPSACPGKSPKIDGYQMWACAKDRWR